jgi:hypothetical protein
VTESISITVLPIERGSYRAEWDAVAAALREEGYDVVVERVIERRGFPVGGEDAYETLIRVAAGLKAVEVIAGVVERCLRQRGRPRPPVVIVDSSGKELKRIELPRLDE